MNDGICSAGVVKHRSIAGVVKLDFYSVHDYEVVVMCDFYLFKSDVIFISS